MVLLVEFAKSWRRRKGCLRLLVWVFLISVATKGTRVPLNCVVNQTEEVHYDYKTSVVENGRCLNVKYLRIHSLSLKIFTIA
jgi:hypothetical protein